MSYSLARVGPPERFECGSCPTGDSKYRASSKAPSPENASWGGYVPCAFRIPYPVLFGNAAVRVNWRVNAQRPEYGSIYDCSMDPDRVGVGYPAYAPHGHN